VASWKPKHCVDLDCTSHNLLQEASIAKNISVLSHILQFTTRKNTPCSTLQFLGYLCQSAGPWTVQHWSILFLDPYNDTHEQWNNVSQEDISHTTTTAKATGVKLIPSFSTISLSKLLLLEKYRSSTTIPVTHCNTSCTFQQTSRSCHQSVKNFTTLQESDVQVFLLDMMQTHNLGDPIRAYYCLFRGFWGLTMRRHITTSAINAL